MPRLKAISISNSYGEKALSTLEAANKNLIKSRYKNYCGSHAKDLSKHESNDKVKLTPGQIWAADAKFVINWITNTREKKAGESRVFFVE